MDSHKDTKLTYRRYQEGVTAWDDLTEKIFDADHSHKCPTYVHRTAPCQGSCPSGHDIRGWLGVVRGMDKPADPDTSWQEYAFQRMVAANPFPSVMGRVCPAPCEDGCNRNEVDDFVGINSVEQYVGDWAIEQGFKLPRAGADSGKRVAVIGGGPAGLSAAFFLRLQGHAVTLFEANSELGGMMRYGIPGYRTPRDMLDSEINRIIDLGVDVRLNTKVGKDLSLGQLDSDFDAVFWGVGAQNGRPLPVAGADAENCVTGVAFLKAFNEGRLRHVKGPIIVVGGGDTSIDVASVARRLGHISTAAEKDRPEKVVLGYTAHDVAEAMARENIDVVLTSLFPIENMTAAEREVNDAQTEGVNIKGSVMPLEVIIGDNGLATGLKMAECTMDGNRPIPTQGTEFIVECDMIVSAIGQFGALDGIEELDSGNGFIAADPVYQVKDRPGHFVGGDIIRPHLLTTAIGHGSIAADGINRFLAGEALGKRPKVDVHHFRLLSELQQRRLEPAEYGHQPVSGTAEAKFAVHNYEDRGASDIIPHRDLFLGHFPFDARNHREEMQIAADKVLGNYNERTKNLSEEAVIREAERCMSCGMCFECDNCVVYCPQDAVFRVKKDERAVGRYVDTDYSKCIGCHICMDVCPSGYIQMGLGE